MKSFKTILIAAVATLATFVPCAAQLGNAITTSLTKDFMMQFHGKTARAIIKDYEKNK